MKNLFDTKVKGKLECIFRRQFFNIFGFQLNVLNIHVLKLKFLVCQLLPYCTLQKEYHDCSIV